MPRRLRYPLQGKSAPEADRGDVIEKSMSPPEFGLFFPFNGGGWTIAMWAVAGAAARKAARRPRRVGGLMGQVVFERVCDRFAVLR